MPSIVILFQLRTEFSRGVRGRVGWVGWVGWVGIYSAIRLIRAVICFTFCSMSVSLPFACLVFSHLPTFNRVDVVVHCLMTINALTSTVAGIVVWLTFHSLGDSTGEAAGVAIGALELWIALFSNTMLLVSMVDRARNLLFKITFVMIRSFRLSILLCQIYSQAEERINTELQYSHQDVCKTTLFYANCKVPIRRTMRLATVQILLN